jgi:hypothetical protein
MDAVIPHGRCSKTGLQHKELSIHLAMAMNIHQHQAEFQKVKTAWTVLQQLFTTGVDNTTILQTCTNYLESTTSRVSYCAAKGKKETHKIQG